MKATTTPKRRRTPVAHHIRIVDFEKPGCELQLILRGSLFDLTESERSLVGVIVDLLNGYETGSAAAAELAKRDAPEG